MLPGKYDIVIYRGSTFSISLGAADEGGTPIDFDVDYINQPGAGLGSMRMYVRPAWLVRPEEIKQDALLELTIANGRISVSGTVITLLLSAVETAALTFNEGKYDLELVTGDDPEVVDKLIYGTITVKDEQTV